MFHGRNGDREDAPNMAFVVTDGVSNVNSFKTVDEAEAAKKDGIHIYAIGIGLADTRELNKIAIIHLLFTFFCCFFSLPKHKCEREIETTTEEPEPIAECHAAMADIVFLVDTSTSCQCSKFSEDAHICQNFLSEASIDSGGVRVGLLVYSTKVHIQFHLNEYSSKNQVFAAIDRIEYSEHGDRTEAPSVALVLTDGVSNIDSKRTVAEAIRAQSSDIHIYAIGIGLADLTELQKIASSPAADNSFSVEDFDELDKMKEEVFAHFCPGKFSIFQQKAKQKYVDLITSHL
ncbi:COL6A [Acanthosepion pharaonis]|uniref:COL6A n=1 Tax=Acanthosepion pharaonis TaxID=158019 RepID=A0A812BSR9_ACAPH|nr:COL6A [Sepia pharaonis]